MRNPLNFGRSEPAPAPTALLARLGPLAAVLGIVLAVIVAYRDVWPWLFTEWRDNPYYTHGVLVPLLSLFLVWRARDALALRAPSLVGYPVIALGLAMLVAGLWYSAYWIAGFSLPVVVAGIVLALFGLPVFRRWLFPLAFLLLMVPLPFDVWVAQWLEAPTATVSTALVRLLGVPAYNDGSLITLPNAQFAVGGVCAGLRSSIALFTLALFVVMVGTPGGLRNKIALLALVIPLALVANTARIAVLLGVANVWGQAAAMNYYHDYSSYVFFGLALLLLLLASGGLRCPLWRLQFGR
ncbi:MAG: exosortase/archaeosortase family protein [Chloroflexi bacterium]|nr:exosortase/archaeosortase family protein [Chloroflexota bacterium]